jgi:serine/threonine-protein kinase
MCRECTLSWAHALLAKDHFGSSPRVHPTSKVRAQENMASDPSLARTMASARQGHVIDGKYLVGECIAWGGMGIVSAATHLHLQKAVAIKWIRPEYLDNHEMAARFLNEARAAAGLSNEHVARVLDFGKAEDGTPYLVMERLEGACLATVLLDRGPLPVREAVDYVLQICEALAEAHARGIVHRDIKPENLFLTHRLDGEPIVKVLDFGISKQPAGKAGRTLTNPSSSMGSPCYMSPEQMRNARTVDARTDIWSLGVVLFELLSGALPFDGESLPELCGSVICDPPRSLRDFRPDLPDGLEAAVDRCLQKSRDDRFADIAELARALESFASPAARATVPSIARVAAGKAQSGEELLPLTTEARARSSDSDLATRAPPSSENGAVVSLRESRITHIPGERPLWGLFLGAALVLGVAGIGTAYALGHDVGLSFRAFVGSVLSPAESADGPAIGAPQSSGAREPKRAEHEP